MKFYLTFYGICISVCSFSNIFPAINDSVKTDSSSFKSRQAKFKIELDYASNNSFKGRKDSSNTPVISPLFKYTTKQRFYIQTSFVHSPNISKTFDEIDLGAGKKFQFTDNFDGSLSYTHYFTGTKTSRIKSTIASDVSSYLGYDWNWLYSQFYFDWSRGSTKQKSNKTTVSKATNDYSFTLANSHDFSFDNVFTNGDEITVTPEADILYGTQNFMTTYKGKGNKTNKTYQDKASKFELTGYSFFLYATYELKNFTIEFSPYYSIPKNLPLGEPNKPYFVMATSIYYTFIKKNNFLVNKL
ncbi:MAG: hypothetical protein ABI315_14890 [Bacteroidia bacterium]